MALDGPGQGESEYDFPIRHNYETAVTAAVDALQPRQDLDTGRLGLYGQSLGGYYATRAAAFEHRLSAVIANGGPYHFETNWERIPQLTRDTLRVRSHTSTDEEARSKLTAFDLTGVGKRIGKPFFVLNGTADRLTPAGDARRIAREVSGPVELLLIEGGNHCAMNRPHLWRPHTADWMATHLNASP